MRIFAYTGSQKLLNASTRTEWDGIGVKFTSGTIASVEAADATTQEIFPSTGMVDTFSITDLDGIEEYASGLVATVTFDSSTNMDDVEIDFGDEKTWISFKNEDDIRWTAVTPVATVVITTDRS